LAGADKDICERRKNVMKDTKRIRKRKSAIRKSEETENKEMRWKVDYVK
jgi:hypothetical protein